MKSIILIEYDPLNGLVRAKATRWHYPNLCFVPLNLPVLINFTVIDDTLGEVEIASLFKSHMRLFYAVI